MSARDEHVFMEGGREDDPLFVMQPEWILAAEISPAAKQAWNVYRWHVNLARARQTGDVMVWPSQKRLCALVGVSPNTLRKLNAELESITALEVIPGRSPYNPMRKANTYRVHAKPDASVYKPTTVAERMAAMDAPF